MADDIVTRLRFDAVWFQNNADKWMTSRLLTEAADEIERLRKAGDDLAYRATEHFLDCGSIVLDKGIQRWEEVRRG